MPRASQRTAFWVDDDPMVLQGTEVVLRQNGVRGAGTTARTRWRRAWRAFILASYVWLLADCSLAVERDASGFEETAGVQTVEAKGFTVALGTSFLPENITPGEPYDFTIPLRLNEKGRIQTNWIPLFVSVHDFRGAGGGMILRPWESNGWTVCRCYARSEPAAPWKVRVDWIEHWNVAPSSQHAVRLRFPMKGLCSTNFRGVPITIGFAPPNMLEVKANTAGPNLALVPLLVSDAKGKDMDDGTGTRSSRFFYMTIRPPRSGETIEVKFALARHFYHEFVVPPSQHPRRPEKTP